MTSLPPDTPDSIRLLPAHTPAWQAQSRQLREQVLRRPWGQPLEPDAQPPLDDLVLCQGDQVLACGRLFADHSGHTAQIRGMAVAPERQRRGYGQRLLDALLLRARGRGVTLVRANVRSRARSLYARQGFVDVGPGPLLFGQIPHRAMQHEIDHRDFSPWHLLLRDATAADGRALQKLVFGCLGEFGLAPERDGIDQDLEQLDQVYAGGHFWVLTDSAGAIQASVALRCREDGRTLELRRMYLHAAQRGRGLGRALLGLALSTARARGMARIDLETASVLRAAHHLYTWAGFVADEGDREARRCDQYLALSLDATPVAPPRTG